MRVGIDTGEVVVSSLDERPGQDFVVVGDTVNRAARIQAAAPPGGIQISRDTHRHVRGRFSFTEVEPLQLKGIAEPVEAFLVGSERPASFRLDEARGVEGVETRTIGRDVSLQRLQNQFWDVAEERRWRVVTVLGDAGVGKSRLLLELDRWLAEIDQRLFWFRGRAAPISQNVANGLLRDVVAARLEIQERDSPAAVREKLEAGFGTVLRVGGVGPPQGPSGRLLAGLRPERQRVRGGAPARPTGPAQARLGPPGRVLRPAGAGAPGRHPARGPALGRRRLAGMDRLGRRGAARQPGPRRRDRSSVAAGEPPALGRGAGLPCCG